MLLFNISVSADGQQPPEVGWGLSAEAGVAAEEGPVNCWSPSPGPGAGPAVLCRVFGKRAHPLIVHVHL